MSDIIELSQADYARRRGLTPKAIEKAIAAGRIPASAVRRQGRNKLIDVAAADLAWPLSYSRVNTSENFGGASAAAVSGGNAPEDRPVVETPALTKARTAGAMIDARLKQLQLNKALGELVDVSDVRRSMERCAEMLARDLDLLPSYADDIASAFTRDGVSGVRGTLRTISRRLRQTMADNMKIVAAESPEEGPEPNSPDKGT